MRFKYTYQDHEGRVHQQEIESPSQAEAYSALRKAGVRPMRVWSDDGRTEEKKFRIGKRVLGVVMAVTALAAGGVAYYLGRGSEDAGARAPAEPSPVRSARSGGVVSSNIVAIRPGKKIAVPMPRRQFALPTADEIKAALSHPADRLLVRYALPGRVSGDPLPDLAQLEDDFYASLEDVLWIDQSDSAAVVDLKRIVQTLKNEAETRTLDGATFKDVIEWFEERQKMEADYRKGVIEKNPRSVANKLLESMFLEPIR